MGIREQLVQAREAAGISQEELAKRAGWDRGHVSKFEAGERGASVQKIDAWLEACGVDLVVVPTALDPQHVHVLPDDQRALLRRLAAIMSTISRSHLTTLKGLIQTWEEDQGDQGSSSPTTQDSRAKAS